MKDTLRVRVAAKVQEALDICRLELRTLDGQTLPAFEAGAHIDVHLPGGCVRPYSLCNVPGNTDRYEIAVLLASPSRGGSHAVHTRVQVGDVLHISPPRNHFALQVPRPDAPPPLLLAGGIGITPILSMAEALSAARQPFTLHYATRSAERTAFRQRLSTAPYAHQVHVHHDDGPPTQRLDLDRVLAGAPRDTAVYVCGPAGMINAVRQSADRQGWPPNQVHWEAFQATAGSSTTACAANHPFEVRLARRGLSVQVAADQTVVQALASLGVHITVSCEQGLCGTCLTPLLEGRADHRDQFLTPEEQARGDCFLPCCSRAADARLVLDL
ncbi:PDR/VanB family oxidoreductase [Ideonella sp. B508-1]|uniref:PDR/VanB family oxidoreductase n=1 Tax=Ideonella sp. B508-1 TaxID=137716 RepID=UPI000477D401|nr:PDR/VanB family oxidoreductase [Ideonella sp. B508-1]